jgi:enoyl-[acyl-carrier-protein] reductase (NADH)
MWLGIFNSQVATNFISVAGRKRKFVDNGSNMVIADYENSIKMCVKQWNVTASARAVFETLPFCF